MEEKAYAKLNLTLDVLGKREDGYHDLQMVMQSISLHDTVTLTEGEGPGVRAVSNLQYLPTGEHNLAVKAALRFWAALWISISRSVPVWPGGAAMQPPCCGR